MFNKSIGKMARKSSNFSADLESVTFNSIRKILPDNTISDAGRQANYSYRNCLFTQAFFVKLLKEPPFVPDTLIYPKKPNRIEAPTH